MSDRISDRIERILLAAQEDIDTLGSELEIAERERDRYRAALERIAGQGLGRWEPDLRCTIGATGEPWEHWATIARKALKS